jgi:hypothetical protein
MFDTANIGTLANLAGLGYIGLKSKGTVRTVALILAGWQAVRLWRGLDRPASVAYTGPITATHKPWT